MGSCGVLTGRVLRLVFTVEGGVDVDVDDDDDDDEAFTVWSMMRMKRIGFHGERCDAVGAGVLLLSVDVGERVTAAE